MSHEQVVEEIAHEFEDEMLKERQHLDTGTGESTEDIDTRRYVRQDC